MASSPVLSTTYVVEEGDYLFGIAFANGVTIGALMRANSLKLNSVIVPGRVLSVPAATRPIPAPSETDLTAPAAPAVAANSAAEAPSTRTDAVVEFLQAQLGKPYKVNSSGADAYDCSGLVVAAFQQLGIGWRTTACGWRRPDVQ